jgi:hypothetical protein
MIPMWMDLGDLLDGMHVFGTQLERPNASSNS